MEGPVGSYYLKSTGAKAKTLRPLHENKALLSLREMYHRQPSEYWIVKQNTYEET
jgi:hypothetical protein